MRKHTKVFAAVLSVLMVIMLVPVMALAADGEPAVTINGIPETIETGKVIEFSVSTTPGKYEGTNTMVKGTSTFTGDAEIEKIEYLETKDGKWYELTGNSFGPSTGFPLMAATSQFRVTFKTAGTYSFKIDIVKIEDNSVLASTSKTVTVTAPAPELTAADFGPWGEAHPGWYNVGWSYANFDTSKITSITVGITNSHGKLIAEYTADEEQVAWQRNNSYIPADGNGQSSAPFYQENNGVALPEGRDLDWTVEKGEAFDEWEPAYCYVVVVADGETYRVENTYSANVHTLEAVPAKDATCTEDGNIAYWVCSCGKYFEDEAGKVEIKKADTVIKAGHTMKKHEAVKATCTEAGAKEYYECSVCGKYFEDEAGTKEIKDIASTVIPAIGHANVEKVPAKPATSKEDGNIAYWYCPDCGKYFSDEALKTEIAKEDTIIHATGSETENDGKGDTTTPQTGDFSMIAVALVVMSLAAAGAVIVTKAKKVK